MLTNSINNMAEMLGQAATFVKNQVSGAMDSLNNQRKAMRENAIAFLKNARGQIDAKLEQFSGAEESILKIIKEKADKIVEVLENVKIEEPQSEVLKKLWPHVAPVLESVKGKASATVAALYSKGADFIKAVKPQLDAAAAQTAEQLKATLDSLVEQTDKLDKLAETEAEELKKSIDANEEKAQALIKKLGDDLKNVVPKN